MSRVITVGAAQLGPIARHESRSGVVKRLLALLGQAHARGCDLVVFPELALTTFFSRWWMDLTRSLKETIFNFALHRRSEHYRLIVERAGAQPPPE